MPKFNFMVIFLFIVMVDKLDFHGGGVIYIDYESSFMRLTCTSKVFVGGISIWNLVTGK